MLVCIDASSVNRTNSRVVILLPIYCMLKQILSDFELSCHIGLLNKISLRVLNGDPRSFLLSEIISDRSNEIIQHPVENSLVKDSSQIRLYCDSLDLGLDKKEILRKSWDKVILPHPNHNKKKEATKNLEKIQIFISYAKEDYEKALRLYNDLCKQEGLNPWIDEKSILPGEKWKVAISNAIRQSRFFIALLSSNSVDKVGYGQKELKEGLEILDKYPESKIFIIPIRLDNCEVSDSRLNEIQYVDFFPNWSKGLAKILETIDTHL